MSCLMLRSRSGAPIWPRKYFDATMFVAVWLIYADTRSDVTP